MSRFLRWLFRSYLTQLRHELLDEHDRLVAGTIKTLKVLALSPVGEINSLKSTVNNLRAEREQLKFDFIRYADELAASVQGIRLEKRLQDADPSS